MPRHDDDLQLRRIPALADDLDRAIIADGSRRDGNSRARAFGRNSFNDLGAEILYAGFLLLRIDRKSTRLNSSHVASSYAVFCLKKKSTTPWATRAAGSGP